MLRASCNALLITAALLAIAARLRQASPNVVATTQEVNRCLSVVRVAAGSRKLADPARRAPRDADSLDKDR